MVILYDLRRGLGQAGGHIRVYDIWSYLKLNFELWDPDAQEIQRTALPHESDVNELVKASAVLAYKTMIADLEVKPDDEYPAR